MNFTEKIIALEDDARKHILSVEEPTFIDSI